MVDEDAPLEASPIAPEDGKGRPPAEPPLRRRRFVRVEETSVP